MKPCPFCGSEEISVRRQDYNFFRATCVNCAATGSHSETRGKAIEAWNERKKFEERIEFAKSEGYEEGYCNGYDKCFDIYGGR